MPDNILLITIDSLRPDHLPIYGYKRTQTPTIDDLSDGGHRFTKAFATGPGTTSSFPALLTGTYPLSYDGLGPLDTNRPRISHQLSTSGFQTGAFHSNPFLSSYFNYDEGFDTFEDYQDVLSGLATKIFPRGIEVNNEYLQWIDQRWDITPKLKSLYKLVQGSSRPYVSAERITSDTVTWLEATVTEPFFCWAHYMDVHHPCHPPLKFRRRYGVEDVTAAEVADLYSDFIRNPASLSERNLDTLVDLYDAAIEYVDAQLGRLITYLESSGRLEETLIVLTSDHGELFGDYDEYGKPPKMYDELINVPLVIANGPPKLQNIKDLLISLIDIPSLFYEVADVTLPDSYEGVSYLDLPRQYVLAEHAVDEYPIIGVRTDEWLFELDSYRNDRRLYALRQDGISQVDERRNSDADFVIEQVLNRSEVVDMEGYDLGTEVSDDLESQLEDLGYL